MPTTTVPQHLLLTPDAFVPLPEGVELPGSPDDFRFQLFALHPLGRFEREDAAGRILVALAHHGEWKAVKMPAIGESIRQELQGRHDGLKECRDLHSVLCLPGGPHRIVEGVGELIAMGLLGTRPDDGEEPWLVWPTPELLKRLERYRVAQPVG